MARKNPDGGAPRTMTADDRRDAAAIRARGSGSDKRPGDWDLADLDREIARLRKLAARGK